MTLPARRRVRRRRRRALAGTAATVPELVTGRGGLGAGLGRPVLLGGGRTRGSQEGRAEEELLHLPGRRLVRVVLLAVVVGSGKSGATSAAVPARFAAAAPSAGSAAIGLGLELLGVVLNALRLPPFSTNPLSGKKGCYILWLDLDITSPPLPQ